MRPTLPLLSLLAGALVAPAAGAQNGTNGNGAAGGNGGLDSATIASFRWRNVGPANMMGRVTDVEGIPSPSKTFYFAAAAGGIWKTTNNGITYRPVFDDYRCISMGDIAIAPSDTNVLYAGTGEEDSRNSISPGCGMFKSTDGGMTWRPIGLEKTEAIGRIVVHPTNPNVAWVAALGAIWRSNPERGLYKTADGGQTWKLVKFISDKAGFVDIAIHPRDPNTLWAASWERVRGPYFLRGGGPGSGLWKSTDGGETWAQVKGGGLPESTLGRIGIAISQSHPDYIYLMVEADTMPNTVKGRAAQRRPSGLYRSTDGGKTWERRAEQNVRPFYYSQVRVDPKNPERVYWSSTPVNFSDDGGKTVRTTTIGLHVDHHGHWIDPVDPDRMIVGNDGGIGITFDKGGNWYFPGNIALGQFYNISFDMGVPYRVCGGLQDNGSWCGPSRRRQGMISNVHWFNVSGGDGFVTQQDPTDPDIVYSESQGGNMGRIDLRTGQRTGLQRPNWRVRYQQFEDSIIIERPDTTRPATPQQRSRIAELRARQRADSAAFDLRWNWNTPFFLSPHNPQVFYAGANRVFKSTKRGDDLYPISPDLTTRDTMKIRVSTRTTGGITPDVTGAETHSTIVSLNESPVRPGILYAGTDDGNVWLTRNDGGTWENLTGRFAGVPRGTYVSRLEPSAHDSATVYVTFDNHRNGDFTPYVFVSNDFGRTFRSIAGNLPTGGPDFVHVIREDPYNRDLLFVGTDVGVFVSVNRGQSWQKFMTGLPTVPVHDLKIHPRDRELIAGTHGRSIWIVDIAPLQQWSDKVVAEGNYLFQPKVAYQYTERPSSAPMGGGGGGGHSLFMAPSPPYGAEIAYRIAQGSNNPREQVRIVITDVMGDTVRTLNGPARTGIHRVHWNYAGKQPPAQPLTPTGRRDSVYVTSRMRVVMDSLAKAGEDTMPIARLRQQILSGELGGGGFGGGGGGGGAGGVFSGGITGPLAFNARPGESAPPRAAGQRGRGGPGGQAEAEEGPQAFQQMGQWAALLRPPGAGGGGGGGFGGINAIRNALLGNRPNAPFVTSGDYLVTLTVGGKTMKQVVRVETVGTGEVAGATTEEDKQ